MELQTNTIYNQFNGNGFLGTISDLSQVYLTMYDTAISPYTYTGSEHIHITNNEISLKCPIQINDEVVLNPRLNVYFEMYAGTSGFTFLQNIVDGSQPIASFDSLDKSVEFFGGLDIPNYYNKNETDAIGDDLPPLMLNTYTKTEVNNLLTNINLTGSENIDTTNNQISLTHPLNINNEAFLNPRVNGYVEIYAAPNGISILQHISNGSQPIAIFNTLNKSVELFCDLDIPNFYIKNEIHIYIYI